ncbi:hypothetical protein [Burkholderia stagnalis]|uniref:hypothetical protein n=1 Tax=Burkholderia stagnalis TaxID=1503054 RepID=UPI00075A876C|nr:hypothetical protein [Burkholderia stagnalis]KVC68556.1 hypothetical protein WS59_08710 [Burkholderia stagnalis]KVN08505.1 hypothetical protein WT10_32695 [Burkholderia stagnalis]KWK64058.1 hypothetical protein WT82_21420 [Burkholderia stagnalis]
MQKYDFTAPASGASQVVNVPGRYLKYVTGTAGGNDTGLVITPGGKPGSKILLYPGQAITLPNDGTAGPNAWTLANATGQAQITGTVVVGDGRIDDNTLSGIVQVVDGGKSRTIAGMAFMANLFAPAVASDYPQIQLWNPAASGKRAVIEQIQMSSTVAGAAQYWIGTAAYSTSGGSPVSKMSGGPAAATQIYYQDPASYTTGQALLGSAALGASQMMTMKLTEPLVLLPGYSLNIQQQVQNAALTAVLELYEEPNV